MLAHSFGAALGYVVAKAQLVVEYCYEACVCALSGLGEKRSKIGPTDEGLSLSWPWLLWVVHMRTGSLDDDNRKMEWTLDALVMKDPFARVA